MPEPPPPAAPLLSAGGDAGSLKVRFAAPPCDPPAKWIQVNVRKRGEKTWQAWCSSQRKLVLGTDSTAWEASTAECVIPKLDVDTTFEVVLMAKSDAGWGNMGPVSSVQLRSLAPPPPAAPLLSAGGDAGSLKVRFAAPPCDPPAKWIQVNVRKRGEKTWQAWCSSQRKLVLGTDSTAWEASTAECVIPKLDVDTTFEVALMAKSDAGWGNMGPVAHWHLESDAVEFVGVRTLEERNADLRKRAIDVDAEPPVRNCTEVAEPKFKRRRRKS